VLDMDPEPKSSSVRSDGLTDRANKKSSSPPKEKNPINSSVATGHQSWADVVKKRKPQNKQTSDAKKGSQR
jgi:hypothetical protein